MSNFIEGLSPFGLTLVIWSTHYVHCVNYVGTNWIMTQYTLMIEYVSCHHCHRGECKATGRADQGNSKSQHCWLLCSNGAGVCESYFVNRVDDVDWQCTVFNASHGSNVQGLETTVTYIESTDEFEVNSPYLTSGKWCGVYGSPMIIELMGLTHNVSVY